MAEWATAWFSASSSTDYSFTRNPYNLDHDVGASSGGSGAAVAANLCLLAVGEDTGGSIRVPSSFCNLVGIRTCPGLVSRAGFCPLIKTQDAPGPMARTVTDCALMLDCMAGFDQADDFTSYASAAAAQGLPRGGSYAANLSSGVLKIQSATFGVVRQFFGDDKDSACAAVNSVMESAVAKLQAQGARFVDVHIPDLGHYMSFPLTYHQRSRSDINGFLAGKPGLPSDIADILPREAPKPYLEMICQVAHGPRTPLEDPSFAARLLARDEFRRMVEALIASHGLDGLIFPSVQVPPPRIADAENGRFWVDGEEVFPTNTFLASITRLPAVSLPAGFTADGLPIGMEIVGLEYQEQHLLELAYGIERVVQARAAPRGL